SPKSDKEQSLASKNNGTKELFGLTNADLLPSLATDGSKSDQCQGNNHQSLAEESMRTDNSPLVSSNSIAKNTSNNLPLHSHFSRQPQEAANMHTFEQQLQTPQKPSSFSSRVLWNLDIDSTDDLAAMRPPSALLPGYGASDAELADSPVRKPATKREPLLRMPSLQSSESNESIMLLKTDSPAMSLDEEMPPLSPFFSRIPDSDILEARDAVRRASVSRRNTLNTQPDTPSSIHYRLQAHTQQQQQQQRQRETWCAPPPKLPQPPQPLLQQQPLTLRDTPETRQRPGMQRYSARMSLSGAMDRWAALSPSAASQSEFETPSKQRQNREDPLSLFALESALEEVEWLVNQKPPMSPIFDGYEFSPNTISVKLENIEKRNRYFQVDVYSLHLSHTAIKNTCSSSSSRNNENGSSKRIGGNGHQSRVVVREVVDGRLSDLLDPADDPDVQMALRHYPWVLRQLQRSSSKRAEETSTKQTAMRVPTRLRTQTLCANYRYSHKFSRPILSFTASSGRNVRSDKKVRAIDIDSMVEAYLSHIHVLLLSNELPTVLARAESAVSETSAATLIQNRSLLLSPKEEFRQSHPYSTTPMTVSSRPPSQPSISKLAQRSDLGPTTAFSAAKTISTAPRSASQRQLRATASVLNLRTNSLESRERERDTKHPDVQCSSRLAVTSSRSMQLMRRRSETPTAATSARTSADTPAIQPRRRSALEPGALGIGAAAASARRIRSPPQTMLSMAYSSLDSGSQPLRAATNRLSPRTSDLVSPSSRMSLSSDCSYDSPLASRSTLVSSLHSISGRGRSFSKQSSQLDLGARKSMGRSVETPTTTPLSRSGSGNQKKAQRSSIQLPKTTITTKSNTSVFERRRGADGTLPMTALQQSPTPTLQKSSILAAVTKASATATAQAPDRRHAVSGNHSRFGLQNLAFSQPLATAFGSGPKSAPVRNMLARDPVSLPIKLPIMHKRSTVVKKPD
ncbi:hypothetical protein FB639_002891, partial [Coemansia asiatica]